MMSGFRGGKQISEDGNKQKGIGEVSKGDEDNPEDQVDCSNAEVSLVENGVNEVKGRSTATPPTCQYGSSTAH